MNPPLPASPLIRFLQRKGTQLILSLIKTVLCLQRPLKIAHPAQYHQLLIKPCGLNFSQS